MTEFRCAASLSLSCIPSRHRPSAPPRLSYGSPAVDLPSASLRRSGSGSGLGLPPLYWKRTSARSSSVRPSPAPVDTSGTHQFTTSNQCGCDAFLLIDPKSMDETLLALPDAVVRHAAGGLSSSDPCALATESTETVIKLKIATVLVCLIWRGLNGQSWRLCQEVKEECFLLVVGQFVEKLLEVARSFSDTSWCACPVKDMLAIFDALFDVLYNIHRLPLKKSDTVAGVSSKMVNAFSAVLEGTISDNDSCEESTIHLTTVVLIQFLEFFHDHRDMVQSMVASGYICSVLLNSWIARLEKETERISQDEKGGRYIFLLNNSYDFSQLVRRPGASFSDEALASRLTSVIEGYRKSYFDECWVPLIMPLLEGHYLKKPNRSSLDEFTQYFVSLCRCHMSLKVRPGLKYKLREEIKNVVFPPYKAFLNTLQANPNRPSEVVYYFKRVMERKKNQNGFTVEQLEQVIEQLYES